MSEKSKHDPNKMRLTTRGKKAVAGLALAAAGIGAGVMVHEVNDNQAEYQQQIETTVQKNPVYLNGKVILNESVKLRSTPVMDNMSGYDPEDNIISSVKKGEILVMDHPLVYTNDVNETYYGATDKEDNLFWVNATGISRQERNSGNDYMDVVEDQNVNGEATHAGHYEDGTYYYSDADGALPVATASSMPAEMADEIYPNFK